MGLGIKLGRLAGGLLVFVAGSTACAGVAVAVGPEVPLPGVQAPSTPPLPSVPSVPSVPNLPSAPTVRPPVDLPPTSAPVPNMGSAPPALTGGSGASGASAGVTTGSFTAVGGASVPSAAATRQARIRSSQGQARRRARERSFRRDVRRHATCFYALSGFERSVLAMRAGLRGTQPRSRQYVARRLKTSARSIVRSERRALRSLHGADDSDGCARSSERLATGLRIAVRMLAGTALAPVLTYVVDNARDQLLASADASAADRGAVAGAKASSNGKGNDAGDSERDSAGITLPNSGTTDASDDGLDAAPIAALLALTALLMAATLASRRHRVHARGDKWSEGPATPAPWIRPEQAPAKEANDSDKKPATQETHGSPAARNGRKRIRTRNRH